MNRAKKVLLYFFENVTLFRAIPLEESSEYCEYCTVLGRRANLVLGRTRPPPSTVEYVRYSRAEIG